MTPDELLQEQLKSIKKDAEEFTFEEPEPEIINLPAIVPEHTEDYILELAKSEIGKVENISDAVALSILATKQTTGQTWAKNIEAIAKAAAINGDFKTALKGYETLGVYLKQLSDPNSKAENNTSNQSIHFHGMTTDEIKEVDREVLAKRYAELKEKESEDN